MRDGSRGWNGIGRREEKFSGCGRFERGKGEWLRRIRRVGLDSEVLGVPWGVRVLDGAGVGT